MDRPVISQQHFRANKIKQDRFSQLTNNGIAAERAFGLVNLQCTIK